MAGPAASRHAALLGVLAIVLAACGGSAASVAPSSPPSSNTEPPAGDTPVPRPSEPPGPEESASVTPPSAEASVAASAAAGTELDWRLEPNFGSVELAAGFTPDPHEVPILSGGPIDATYLGAPCTGWATAAPDFDVRYEAGSMTLLRFYFVADEAGEDATLIINAPDGSWHCNDDSAVGVFDPMVDFTTPQGGLYDVWVGTYEDGSAVTGTLYVTELSANRP
ncbi:MAG TPA: hypothetical protein VHR55_02360 [Candidatus Limnocylindria bacterium]|nr:hypothetical protein [Candidatus Limnocylindria bacterium]